ncbi:hypothetical protein EW026_g4055 [Hermanssonia centrifuga]|uniref:Inhibitor I9 domain-containing protein n=1 Tax=Hermanssonia centrifuga TaxID=98765 RepID=A0A4S4KJK9_9APHY|nr:hypothetical protein EW026_g4055 [Hermanssonia centrifuga]
MSSKYIVVFKKSASQEEVQKYADEVNANGGSVTNVYDSVLKGFSAAIPDGFLSQLQSLQGNGVIDYIEPDSVVTIQ